MWNQTNFSESSPGVRLTADQTTGGQGWFGQIGGGCDYQFPVAGWGSFVVGVLADYSFMNLHGQFDDDASGDNGREKESGAWAVGARVGYIVTPNLLTYFNGGWTQTRFDQINLTAFESSASSGAFVPATTYSGWFLGGGTETSLAGFFGLPLPPGLFLRSEYRYSSFSAKDVSFGGTALSGETSVNMKKNVQTISTALVWKFNWGGY
jgi:outer membrane immunogenic protein